MWPSFGLVSYSFIVSISDVRRRLCEFECMWRRFGDDFHNIDLQLSYFHLFLLLHLSGAATELFHDRNVKWLISLADGRCFCFGFFFSPLKWNSGNE